MITPTIRMALHLGHSILKKPVVGVITNPLANKINYSQSYLPAMKGNIEFFTATCLNWQKLLDPEAHKNIKTCGWCYHQSTSSF